MAETNDEGKERTMPTTSEIVEAARTELSVLTGLELNTTLSVNRVEGGWRVQIEAVEKHSIPEGMDVLATYEVVLDEEANLTSFNRLGLRKRIQTDEAVVMEE